ncbi:MAG: tRNA-uridine aminocarboxypropyltransferase [Myxococcota bacterium]
MTEASPQRAYCYRCFKPAVVCVCGGPAVRNRTQAVIIQHPREVRHALGTERLARLGLERCEVHVAWDLKVTPSMIPPGAALLYPSAKARDVSELDASKRPTALVAIDGTWSQAKVLYRDNPWLADLPHVKLAQPPPSNYRIRREPKDNYVSTLEALVHALVALEPETNGWDALLSRFARMIDQQIAYTERPPNGSYRHKRPPMRKLRPHPLLRDRDALVAGYTEYVVYQADGVEHEAVVQVCLQRLADGEHREWLIRPGAAVDDRRFDYMGLSRARVEAGITPSELGDAIRDFVRPSDALVTWNHPTMRQLLALAPFRDAVSVKAAYANFTRSKPGQMEPILSRHGITPEPQRHSGRAGERVAWLVAIAGWMNRQ